MCPNAKNVFDILHWYAKETPQAPAVYDQNRSLTYFELLKEVDSIAMELIDIGLKKGSRVATWSDPGGNFWSTFLASNSIGAMWTGLSPKSRLSELEHILGDFDPDLIFLSKSILGLSAEEEVLEAIQIAAPDAKVVKMSDFCDRDATTQVASVDKKALELARMSVTGEELGAVLYTSGTTGKPKGAILTQSAICDSAKQNQIWSKGFTARSLCHFPINHAGALNNISCNTLINGGCVVFQPGFDPVEWFKVVQQQKISFYITVPTVLVMLIQHPSFECADLSSLKLIMTGGSSLTRELAESILDKGIQCGSVYGQTETCGIISIASTHLSDSIDTVTKSLGHALPGVEWTVAGQENKNASSSQGELLVRAKSNAVGYLNQPVLTKTLFTQEGFLRTGDVVSIIDEERFALAGRLKEMYKSGGENVYPLEVEGALNSHSDVLLSAVVSVPDYLFGEVGHAYITTSPGTAPDESDLKIFLKTRLSNFKIPKRFFNVDEFPRLPNGKIDKRTLAKRSRSIAER